ncbi:hypothetical protein TNCV_1286611 [Trichonephila clavipes]|nr:hypothetical protein TNCV_1286611 [Trichonephila clavipes]
MWVIGKGPRNFEQWSNDESPLPSPRFNNTDPEGLRAATDSMQISPSTSKDVLRLIKVLGSYAKAGPVTGLYLIFPINPLGESLEPALS